MERKSSYNPIIGLSVSVNMNPLAVTFHKHFSASFSLPLERGLESADVPFPGLDKAPVKSFLLLGRCLL